MSENDGPGARRRRWAGLLSRSVPRCGWCRDRCCDPVHRFLGRFLYRADPYAIHPAHALQAPSWAFPLGTDELGRDGLALLLAGGQATLEVALPAALLAFVCGLGYGLAGGAGAGLAG